MTKVAKIVTAAALAAFAPLAASAGAYQNDAGSLVTGTTYETISGETVLNSNTVDVQNPYRNAAGGLVSALNVSESNGAAVPSVSRDLQPALNANAAGPAVNDL